MIDVSFLNQINRFDLVIKKKVLSQYAGERQSSMTGEGLIFKDYREYIPGDDFRQIDWSLYARTDKFFIRRYESERNMAMHILLDASGSMDFGNKETKYEYASRIGLGFSYLAMKNNEKFEFSTFSDKMDYIRPKKGQNALMSILDFLNKKKVSGKSHFYESIASYRERLKSKSMVVLLSDFLFDLDEFEKSLQLFRKSEVIVVQVLDPEEIKFSMTGDFLLKDSEHGGILRTFISHRLRTNYKSKMQDHIERLKKICIKNNTRFVSVNTKSSIFDVFYEVLR